jgi:translin
MSDLTAETAKAQRQKLQEIAEAALTGFIEKHDAREQALRLSREAVRSSANSIRATHRGDFDLARELLVSTARTVQEIEERVKGQPSVYYAGFVEDGQKEYVEAAATLAFVQGTRLPTPDELGIGPAPYLNGLAEAAGELRRFILDMLRRDDISRCEEVLVLMEEVYSILTSMDFPEAVTRGLRRNTDMVRGVLERTRADLTMALRQRRLESKLDAFRQSTGDGNPA